MVLGCLLGGFWGAFGRLWGLLASLWPPFGSHLGTFGHPLASIVDLLGHFGPLGYTWAHFGGPGSHKEGVWGTFWGLKVPFWVNFCDFQTSHVDVDGFRMILELRAFSERFRGVEVPKGQDFFKIFAE